MGLYNVNETIITELKALRDKLMIHEIEENIERKDFNTSYEQDICNIKDELYRLAKRLVILNWELINKHEALKYHVQMCENLYSQPCGVEYVNNPLNQRLYMVVKFYNDLNVEFHKASVQQQCVWFKPGPYGYERSINLNALSTENKERASRLNEYLILNTIKECIDDLIFFIESIQVNYLCGED